jgi:hypothetical protein
MSSPDRTIIFHLYRQDGSALFLHPFDSTESVFQYLEAGEVAGKYGKEPRVESLTLFRNDMYQLVERSVASWLTEARFIPKFLVSSAVFLVVYLLMSLVFRDPLPMVDELLIAFGASILTYILMGRRDRSSNVALKKRVEFRTKVDRIVFEEDPFVKKVEEALQWNEAAEREKVLQSLFVPLDESMEESVKRDAVQLLAYLERRFSSGHFKKQEKLLEKYEASTEASQDIEQVNRWVESKNVDLGLFALYRWLKRATHKV